MSNILDELQMYSFNRNGEPLCIYGDPAYPLRIHLQTPYKHARRRTDEQMHFKSSMNSVRVAVEWVFADITNYFSFLDFKRNLKIGLSPIGQMYVVCALLRKSHTCLYGSNTSSYFSVLLPTLQNYFQV